MEQTSAPKTETCLNCGSHDIGNYCARCGQKAQATRQPLRVFLSDAVESLFNIDNRWFRTIKDLFAKPGKVTQDYIEGKRARYLPPLRIYLSVSVIYFLLVWLVDSNQIFFINFESDDGSIANLAEVIQYLLFFLVPVFAFIVKVFHRKRKEAYYVEYLIFSFHIHTLWLVFLMVELFTIWLDGSFTQNWVKAVAIIIGVPAQLATFGYLIIYLKKVFNNSWLKSFSKSFGIMILYMATLTSFMALYYFVILDWFK
jgi:hypothetical protein